MKNQTTFLAIMAFLAATSAACANPPATYASPRAGYALDMPKGFVAPRSHEQGTVATDLGALEVGIDHFVYEGDGLFSGGQGYLAVGMHFTNATLSMTTDDAFVASFDAGMATSLLEVGTIRERRRKDDAGGAFVGEEIIVDGTSPKFAGRTFHIRIFIAPRAVYALMASGDTKYVESRSIRDQRAAFFGAFRMTEGSADTPISPVSKSLGGAAAAAIAARASRVLFH